MSRKMRAAVLHAPGKLICEEVDIPKPGKRDVLVKVTSSGVCGSDIPRVLTTGTYSFPTIPGHEFGGIICETGSEVSKDLLGKRAAVIPLIPCRRCELCEIGQFAQCKQYDFLGSRSDGGFAEYVKVPEDNLVIVPEGVDEDAVAFLEPISVALHVVQNCGIPYGGSAVIFGLGAIGIFIAQWAKAFGAAHVFAVDLDERKVKIAKEMGLTDAICSASENTAEIISEKTGGAMADVVFEAAGAKAAFRQGIELLKTNGVMGLVGRPGKPLSIEEDVYEKILRSQLTIKGTWSFEFTSYPLHAWQVCLQALKDNKIQTKPIVSHKLPLGQTLDAVNIMNEKKEFFYKILIKPEV